MRARAVAAAALCLLLVAASAGAGSEPGVTIDGDATYTTSTSVLVTLKPPPGANEVSIWNEDDESQALKFLVTENRTFDWNIAAEGPASGARTVRARYSGPGVDQTVVYSDDILLDLARPRILKARVTGASRRAGCSFTLRLDARDSVSGVASMSYSFGPGTERRTFGYRPSRRIRVPRSVRSPRVIVLRVADGAGNVSRTRRVGIRRACT